MWFNPLNLNFSSLISGFDNLNPQDQKLMDSLNRQLDYLSYFDNLPVGTLKVSYCCVHIL